MINTKTFLQFFPDYCLQTFDDKGKDKRLVMCGKPTKESVQRLGGLNNKGAGIFFTPNSFPSGVRKQGKCTKVNAWFFEIDDIPIEEQWEKIESGPFMPSLIVQTRKSLHCYFLAKNATIENFRNIQKGLIQYYGADRACKDITRVLRIPGFYHMKADPVKVKIVHDEGNYYSEEDMLKEFPFKELKKVKHKKKETPSKFWDVVSKLGNKLMLERISGSSMVGGDVISFRARPSGGEYIDVNGEPADAWLDEQGMIGSGKGGGPTYIQWLEYYKNTKGEIAQWLKDECMDLLAEGGVKADKESKASKKEAKQTSVLLEVFAETKPVLFKDEMDEAFVRIEMDKKKHIVKCESSRFEKYLHRLYWLETKELIGGENLSKIVKLISAKAEYGSTQFTLYNRIAFYDGDFWYDLKEDKAIRCREGTWEIVEDVPVLFRSFQHQQKQFLPATDGADVCKIMEHVRINDENQQILFLVWLVAAFIPEIPHPILVMFGEKGAAKSTTMRFTRSLIDPSKIDLLSLPHSNELPQQLFHHYAVFYDNVHRISRSVSDDLCRAVTGAGSSKRRLYTDDDDVIYKFRRVVAVNGINNVVQHADLLDRSILIELGRISKSDRKTEAVLNKTFERDKEMILGGVFNVLAEARRIYVDLDIKEYPRMADFAKWGYAIAEALGHGGEAFLKAYDTNINQQNEEVLENDSVANTICVLMEDNDDWEGTPTELFEELLKIAEDSKINAKSMPKTPATLGRQISVVLSNLLESGIEITRVKDGPRRGRIYNIVKRSVAPVSSVAGKEETTANCDSSDGCDSNNDTTGTAESYLNGEGVLGDLNPDDQVEVVQTIFNSDN
jgi:hypothetical protein